MGKALVRPRVAEIVFKLYDRPLHPELFEPVAARTVEHAGARLTARLTRTGHTLSWSGPNAHLEEIIALAGGELPSAGLRLTHLLDHNRRGRAEAPGVRYQVSSQVEVLEPEAFVHFHEELLTDGARKGLVFHCRENNRVGLSPLGVVIVEALPACLSVNTFHTFPDELAVVKRNR